MRLEPYEGKLSSTVLRGGSGSNATSLPDESQEHALRWDQRWPTGFDLNQLTAGCSKELKTVQKINYSRNPWNNSSSNSFFSKTP